MGKNKIADIIPCEVCGKEIVRAPFQVRANRKYCSRECDNVSRAKESRPCEICKETFKPRTKATRYCSIECRSVGMTSERVTKECPACGESFETYPSVDKKFCNRGCMNEAMKGQARKPRKGQYKNCTQCGKEFYVSPSSMERTFCSRGCGHQSFIKDKIVKDCQQCGKEMILHQSQHAKVFCSTKCSGMQSSKDARRLLDWTHNGKHARLDGNGYIWVWEPERARKSYKGWMPQHRLVMELQLGRQIHPTEDVHHINADKQDNRPENLEVISHREHMAMHRHPLFKAMKDQLMKAQAELIALKATLTA